AMTLLDKRAAIEEAATRKKSKRSISDDSLRRYVLFASEGYLLQIPIGLEMWNSQKRYLIMRLFGFHQDIQGTETAKKLTDVCEKEQLYCELASTTKNYDLDVDDK
ncbi:hypothetical protein Tco_1160229, partial [Tanacetum coccineum]